MTGKIRCKTFGLTFEGETCSHSLSLSSEEGAHHPEGRRQPPRNQERSQHWNKSDNTGGRAEKEKETLPLVTSLTCQIRLALSQGFSVKQIDVSLLPEPVRIGLCWSGRIPSRSSSPGSPRTNHSSENPVQTSAASGPVRTTADRSGSSNPI